MTHCPRCQAPERPDHQSVVDVGSKMRLACLMGHSRWVELDVITLAPRAIGKHEVSNRMYPPKPCERCGFPIVPRLALNQKRHGRCAALETAERRRAKQEALPKGPGPITNSAAHAEGRRAFYRTGSRMAAADRAIKRADPTAEAPRTRV